MTMGNDGLMHVNANYTMVQMGKMYENDGFGDAIMDTSHFQASTCLMLGRGTTTSSRQGSGVPNGKRLTAPLRGDVVRR